MKEQFVLEPMEITHKQVVNVVTQTDVLGSCLLQRDLKYGK